MSLNEKKSLRCHVVNSVTSGTSYQDVHEVFPSELIHSHPLLRNNFVTIYPNKITTWKIWESVDHTTHLNSYYKYPESSHLSIYYVLTGFSKLFL